MFRNLRTASIVPLLLSLPLLSTATTTRTDTPANTENTKAAITVMPGNPTARVSGILRVAVVSATDTEGNTETARRALAAANAALINLPGYVAVPANDVA